MINATARLATEKADFRPALLSRPNAGFSPERMMQAIETSYKGYRFRSRLEARWAVFFDALKMDWEYEREGFELPDGTRYLPDFFIRMRPQWEPQHTGAGLWFEVKPIGALSDDAAAKANWLSRITPHSVVVLCGDPGGFTSHKFSRGTHINFNFRFDGVDHEQIAFSLFHRFTDCINIKEAIERSRGARFEFGETG